MPADLSRTTWISDLSELGDWPVFEVSRGQKSKEGRMVCKADFRKSAGILSEVSHRRPFEDRVHSHHLMCGWRSSNDRWIPSVACETKRRVGWPLEATNSNTPQPPFPVGRWCLPGSNPQGSPDIQQWITAPETP